MMRTSFEHFINLAFFHVESSVFLGTTPPESEHNLSTVMSPEELENLLEPKREPYALGAVFSRLFFGGVMCTLRGYRFSQVMNQ